MNRNKILFDISFIALTALILMFVIDRAWLYEYRGFALLPLLAAYYLGQFVERKVRKRGA